MATATAKKTTTTDVRLRAQYRETIRKDLQKELKLKNINQVPVLEKVVVNVGLGRPKTTNEP
jgi:ribosomal protein L5